MNRLLFKAVLLLFFANGTVQGRTLQVVTSFSVFGDWVKAIGGQQVSVQNLVGPDEDLHHYSLKAGDMVKLNRADLIIAQGLHLEPQPLTNALRTQNSKLLWLERAYPREKLLAFSSVKQGMMVSLPKTGITGVDPHTWHDPFLVRKALLLIRDKLIEKDPTHCVEYKERYSNYVNELDKLEEWAKKQFAQVDSTSMLMTIHGGFAYLAQHYHLPYYSLEAGREEAQLSAKKISFSIDLIKKNKIKYIFLEKNAERRLAELIAKPSHTFIVDNLYSDFLSSKDSQASTYLSLMRHNIQQITFYLKRRVSYPQ
ncbi:MAG: metal ABC transporter substrate-binding protein [Neisseriaceae bacterium]